MDPLSVMHENWFGSHLSFTKSLKNCVCFSHILTLGGFRKPSVNKVKIPADNELAPSLKEQTSPRCQRKGVMTLINTLCELTRVKVHFHNDSIFASVQVLHGAGWQKSAVNQTGCNSHHSSNRMITRSFYPAQSPRNDHHIGSTTPKALKHTIC